MSLCPNCPNHVKINLTKPQGGDYSYSGMHDHGPLPLPKEGGDLAKLIGMVNEARKHSDEILTKLIDDEKASAPEMVKKKKKKHKFDEAESTDQNDEDNKNASRQKIES